MGKYGLNTNLNTNARNSGDSRVWGLEECDELIKNFSRGYPTLTKWQTSQITFAKKNGYVVTPFGRRRYLPLINSTDYKDRGQAERHAKNTVVQSAGSDFMQCGIINMHQRLDPTKFKFVATVHDSVVCEVREDYVDEFVKIAKDCLEKPKIGNTVVPLCNVMPFIAEFEIGPSYGQLEEYTYPYNKKGN